MSIDKLTAYWAGIPVPTPSPPLGVTEAEARALLAKLVCLPCTTIKCRNSGIGRPSLVCTRCEAVDQVEKWLPKVAP